MGSGSVSEAQPDVAVGGHDEFAQGVGVHGPRPAELHVPHALAGAVQKAGRIVERRPEEEAHIHMRAEGVDVPKGRVSHARRGMAIVQKLANVRAATAHLFKPWLGDPSHLFIGLGKPSLDAGVSPNGAREPEEIAHRTRLPAWLLMSRPP